jgi:hypothetical protein
MLALKGFKADWGKIKTATKYTPRQSVNKSVAILSISQTSSFALCFGLEVSS